VKETISIFDLKDPEEEARIEREEGKKVNRRDSAALD